MIFFTPVIVKYMEKHLSITKPCYGEHIFSSPLALRYIEVSLYHP